MSDLKLVKCEMNTKETGSGPGTGQKRDYTWIDRGTRSFGLEEENIRLVKSNESDRSGKTKLKIVLILADLFMFNISICFGPILAVGIVCHNSNINHTHFGRAGSNDHQKPIGNALTTLFFKDLRKELESLGLAFNVRVVKTQNLINKVNFCLKNCICTTAVLVIVSLCNVLCVRACLPLYLVFAMS